MCTTCWTGGLNHPLWFNWLAGTLATIVNTGTVDGHPTNSGSHIRGQTHWHVGPGVTTPCALNLGALWCAWMPDERQSWSKVTLAQSLLPKQRSNDCQIDTKLVAEARKLCLSNRCQAQWSAEGIRVVVAVVLRGTCTKFQCYFRNNLIDFILNFGLFLKLVIHYLNIRY